MQKLFLLTLLFSTLSACSQVVATQSDDPYTLMENAEMAANSGRGGTAFKSANKALSICVEKKDRLCEAEAYNTLALICDNPTPQGAKQCGSPQALDYLKHALDIYAAGNNPAYMSRTYLNMANITFFVHKNKKANAMVCSYYAEAKRYYELGKSSPDFVKIAELRGDQKMTYAEHLNYAAHSAGCN